MNRKIVVRSAIGAIALYFILFSAIGYYFSEVALRPDNWRGTSQYQRIVDLGWLDTSAYRAMSVDSDTFRLQGAFDYELEGTWIPVDSAIGSVVLCHGYRMDRWSMVKYAVIWHDLGYNVLIYDHRFHGMSGGLFLSYGLLEREDLDHMVAEVRERAPGLPVGVHGESMGAATVMMYTGWSERQQPINFAVEDCGYSSTRDVLSYKMTDDYGLPDWGITRWANRVSGWRFGFDFNDVVPREEIADGEVPMLFIHGDSDTFVPTYMIQENYEAYPGPKQQWLAPGSEHAKSVLDHPEEYRKVLVQFLSTL